jgi:hypothetical protein
MTRVVQLAAGSELLHESAGGAHRPDRVRARRPEADLEEIECADEHRGMRVVDWDSIVPRRAEMASRSAARRSLLTITVLLVVVTMASAAPTDAGWRAYQRQDYPAALADFERRAGDGDRVAQFNLAMMLMRGEAGSTDIAGGLAWLQRSADAGLAQAEYNLGLLYEGGVGVPRSLSAATLWWGKAAEQGHADAQVQLATQYFLGRGAPKDWTLAAKWYEAAAENGDSGAQYIIGSFYEHGDGVAQDLRKALAWYALAARQGDIGAAAQAKDVARRLSAAPRAP